MLINITQLDNDYIDVSYVIEEFASTSTEDENIDLNLFEASGFTNSIVKVTDLLKALKSIESEETATHVEVHFNTDTNCYVLSKFKLEKANKDESDLFYEKIQKELTVLERISELENELKMLKNELSDMDVTFSDNEIEDDLPF